MEYSEISNLSLPVVASFSGLHLSYYNVGEKSGGQKEGLVMINKVVVYNDYNPRGQFGFCIS